MAIVSDPYRDDGHEDGICLTITRYQAPMLRKVLRESPRENWIMLAISPAVLWENPCQFCDQNASSNWIRNTRRNLSTAYAFSAMFDDFSIPKRDNGAWVNVSKRQYDMTPDSVPTDPQAEVIVKAHIPVDRILGIWVETPEQGERVDAMLESVCENIRPGILVAEYSFEKCDGA